jgi:hypothetical protein
MARPGQTFKDENNGLHANDGSIAKGRANRPIVIASASEAIQIATPAALVWIASSLRSLAMTTRLF